MEYDHGMLNCSWNNGFPRYVFSIDDKRKVVTTTIFIKVESISDKGVDYIYTFYSKESTLLGEMSVSTSFELCPHGTRIMETKYILCVNCVNIKGLSKMDNIFKGHSYKPELAAIVVKDLVCESRKEVEIGGWGLKFLKKEGNCESCKQNASMNVLVPAGFHGGPRTRPGGGPSSLVERWRSGGLCDCGGWDLGCPLTVLRARLNDQTSVFVESISFDLFVEGCKSVPVLKMVEVGEGVYDVRYKSFLSPLQSLSIVVAAIHSRYSILRPRSYAN